MHLEVTPVPKWEFFKSGESYPNVQGPSRYTPSLDQAFRQKNFRQTIDLEIYLSMGHNLNLFHAIFFNQNLLCQVNCLWDNYVEIFLFIAYWPLGWSCNDHVATMYRSREWSYTHQVTDHALITWLSCTDHETDHALITSISCDQCMI